MIRSLFLFPRSETTDIEAVERFVSEVLIPMTKSRPEVVSVCQSSGPLMGPGGPKPYVKVVEITHASLDDMMTTARSGGGTIEAQLEAVGGFIMAYEVLEA